ncbi:hypothetical protein LWI29_020184 [Acer saccharum]|uniref:Uncharacterized protein n=1 Tax=Acer saccharum TaxID=4024 RepID=A0AA39SGP8_ACESA|nr:hypothetical protein LWI29_020184 [Acer saccharum]
MGKRSSAKVRKRSFEESTPTMRRHHNKENKDHSGIKSAPHDLVLGQWIQTHAHTIESIALDPCPSRLDRSSVRRRRSSSPPGDGMRYQASQVCILDYPMIHYDMSNDDYEWVMIGCFLHQMTENALGSDVEAMFQKWDSDNCERPPKTPITVYRLREPFLAIPRDLLCLLLVLDPF